MLHQSRSICNQQSVFFSPQESLYSALSPKVIRKKIIPTSQVRTSAMFVLQIEEIKDCGGGLVSSGIIYIGY